MKLLTKRLLTLGLAFLMILSAAPAASAYTGVSSWAEPEVTEMDELGLIPDSLMDSDLSKRISRLDMCRVAVLAYEKATGKTLEVPQSHPFTDTTDPDAEKAFSAGLVSGNGDGTFRPDDPLSRVEFFSFVGQFLNAGGFIPGEADYADLSGFADASSLPGWAREATQLTVGLGVVLGDGKNLNWSSYTSAQEALMMFLRAYKILDTGITDPPVDEPDEPDSGFINLAAWAEESVYAMDKLGLIPDEVRSSPMNGIITRQNLCKVAMLAYKQLMFVTDADLGTPPSNPFTDTSDRDVLNAYRLGIVNGKGNGQFCPNEPISRQDFFKISVNFLNTIGYLYEDDTSVSLSAYSDGDQVASYAKAPTRLLISIGVVKGSDGKIKPTESISAQEALSIFYRVHTFVTTWDGSDGEDTRTEISREEAQAVVDLAMSYLGYPYVYGGKSPSEGFDCSGFVYYVYKQFGYTLNPGATTQWKSLPDVIIPRDQLQPGDLVFFSGNGEVSGMEHVAIYIGNGQMIHASTPSTGVIITDLNEPYYVRRYLGAKRVIN